LLWLKPLATRVVRDSESGLRVSGLRKADGVQTAV